MKIIKRILYYLVLVSIIWASFNIGVRVETEGFFNRSKSPVSLAEIESSSRIDYIGQLAGEGIPVATSAEQLHDWTYSETGYVTIRPEAIIATGGYRLMDSYKKYKNYSYTTKGRKIRSTPPREYTQYPDFFDLYLYNQLYVVQFSDGTSIGAYMNDYYAKKFNKGNKEMTFPIGEIERTNDTEKKWLEAMEIPSLDKEELLLMIDNSAYREIESSDMSIRIALGLITFVGLNAIFIFVQVVYQKRVEKRNNN